MNIWNCCSAGKRDRDWAMSNVEAMVMWMKRTSIYLFG